MLADHIRAMQRVCFAREPSEADLEVLGSRERWLVYRDLVRHRLRHVVGVAMSRTRGVVGDDAFSRTVDEWLATGGPATRFFRHIPRDMFEFAVKEWRGREPAWLADLARYEITSWDVRYAPPSRTDAGEFAFDRVPVLSPAVSVLRIHHAVHKTPTPADGYEPEPTLLCVYRGKNHRPVPWTLNALAADLVEAWARGDRTVTESVHAVAAAHNTEIGPVFVEKLSTMIADFLTRGILVGGDDPSPSK